MKTYNQFNESIRNKMTGKSEEEIIKNLSPDNIVVYKKLQELEKLINSKTDFNTHIYFKNNKFLTISLVIDFKYITCSIFYDVNKYRLYISKDSDLTTDTSVYDSKTELLDAIYIKVKVYLTEILDDINKKLNTLKHEKIIKSIYYKKYKEYNNMKNNIYDIINKLKK